MRAFFAQQQAKFQVHLSEQIATQNARFETLASKPPVARKPNHPNITGCKGEDPDLWFVAIKQGAIWFRPDDCVSSSPYPYELVPSSFVTECDRSETVRTWTTFKTDALSILTS
ncbi:Hypothetical protein PHPALM_15293 [Phytophthora palmivora]|uniref:Uncharacterized protein n=1 Tax=Phytophthora palmivora TaxID=4796 RepID=A0A2P4XSI4_9STRA|nr:Hypothetical protein PHPALM_15293 [Phytophthora palmivora]